MFIDFQGTHFTVITDDKEKPWFIAKELCDYLGLKNPATACKNIPDCNKKYMVFDHLKSKGAGRGGDNGRRLIVNEPGAYQLIFKSKKPEAVVFQSWLYHDVLPSIRKTGEFKMQRKITPPPVEAHILDQMPTNMYEALMLTASIEKARMEAVELTLELQKEVAEQTHGLKIARKTIEQATAKVKILEPKALGYDQLANSEGQFTLTAVAKMFDENPHTFTAKLRENKILYYQHGKMLPYQTYKDRGWFVVKEVPGRSEASKKTYFQTLVTPKGVKGLWNLFGSTQKKLF